MKIFLLTNPNQLKIHKQQKMTKKIVILTHIRRIKVKKLKLNQQKQAVHLYRQKKILKFFKIYDQPNETITSQNSLLLDF